MWQNETSIFLWAKWDVHLSLWQNETSIFLCGKIWRPSFFVAKWDVHLSLWQNETSIFLCGKMRRPSFFEQNETSIFLWAKWDVHLFWAKFPRLWLIYHRAVISWCNAFQQSFFCTLRVFQNTRKEKTTFFPTSAVLSITYFTWA